LKNFKYLNFGMKYLFITLFFIIQYPVLYTKIMTYVYYNQLIDEISLIDHDTNFRYVYLSDNLGNEML